MKPTISELKWNKRSYVGDKNGQIGHQHLKIAIASESEISYVWVKAVICKGF